MAFSKVPALVWAQVIAYGVFAMFDGCFAYCILATPGDRIFVLVAVAAISKVLALVWAQVLAYGGFVMFDGCFADCTLAIPGDDGWWELSLGFGMKHSRVFVLVATAAISKVPALVRPQVIAYDGFAKLDACVADCNFATPGDRVFVLVAMATISKVLALVWALAYGGFVKFDGCFADCNLATPGDDGWKVLSPGLGAKHSRVIMLVAMAAFSEVPALVWAQIIAYDGFVKIDGCFVDCNFATP